MARPKLVQRDSGGYTACHNCRGLTLCQAGRIGCGHLDLSGRVIKRYRSIPRGGYLFNAGDPFHSVTVVCAGSVKTYTVSYDGRMQVVGFHLPGELLGLNAVRTKQHLGHAMALEPTTVCEILFSRIEELVEQVPALQRMILALMSGEILHEHDTMASLLGKKTAEERLAAYLFCISRRFAARGFSAEEFDLSMSRSDIGNYLGLAKETVSRLFSRFEDDGMLTVRAKHVRVNDLTRLGHLAGASLQPA